MSRLKINVGDHPEMQEMLKDNPELKETLNEALEEFAKSDQGRYTAAVVSFLALTKQIFDSMLTVMCVSANRLGDKSQIHDEIVLQVGDFVTGIIDKALDSEESLDLCCRHVMLRTRALAEDALGMSRYDGTEKGSETPCPK